MENPQEKMPIDRWLVQECFKQIALGPKAFMNWASGHAILIDQKFVNQLKKMAEFSRKNNQEEQATAFEFLEKCINKMFDLEAFTEPVTVTEENFTKNYETALELLKKNKARYAIPYFQALLFFLNHKPNPNIQGVMHANMGIAFAQIGNREKGIEHMKSALELPLSESDQEKIYANLGTIYRDMENFSLSLEYHQKALDIARKQIHKDSEFVHLSNVALLYLDKKELDKSLLCQKEALEIAKKFQNQTWIKDCMAKIAMLYALQGDKEHCKEFCEKGLSV